MTKIAVVYHSGSGHTSKQAEAIAEGSDGVLINIDQDGNCLLYTSPSPRDVEESRMPSSA